MKLQSTLAAKIAMNRRSHKTTEVAAYVEGKGKRRELFVAPTPERIAKSPEGFDIGGTAKPHRQKTPLEMYGKHFSADQVDAGDWYIELSLRANRALAAPTANYSGASGASYGPRSGRINSKSERDDFLDYNSVRNFLGEYHCEIADKLIEQAYDLNGRVMSVAEFGASKIKLIDEATCKGHGIGSLQSCLAKLAEYRILKFRQKSMMGHNSRA